jgi:hypothetical protein
MEGATCMLDQSANDFLLTSAVCARGVLEEQARCDIKPLEWG